MIFKCPNCGETPDYLEVEVVNIVQYSSVYIPEEEDVEDLMFGSFDTNYDDSRDNYTCPECGYELLVHDEVALLEYIKENQKSWEIEA